MEQQYLHALTISEILDRAIRIYRAKFFPLLGIVAVMLVPEGILRFVAAVLWGDTPAVNNLLSIIFQNLATLALIVAISNTNQGKDFAINSSYSEGSKRFWSVIGANFLMGMTIGLPMIAIGFCLATIAPLGWVGIILALPFIIFVSTRWSLSSSVIVLEQARAMDGLRRSWELTKDFFWRVLGTSFLASMLSVFLTTLPYYMLNFILESTGASYQVIELASVVLEQTSLVLVLPFTAAVQVLIYYDLRIRKEGFDLILRAETGNQDG